MGMRGWARVTLGFALGCAGGDQSFGGIPNGGLSGPSGTTDGTQSETGGPPDDDEGPPVTGPSSVSASGSPSGGDMTETSGDTDGGTGPPIPCSDDPDCEDGDACTDDLCVNGSCVNSSVDCSDGLPCTTDACDAGACVNTPDDTQCDDGNLCNGAEACSPVTGCTNGTAVVCDDGEVCTDDTCNPGTGMCETSPVEACVGGDGCCPGGCSVAADNDCVCTNLAPMATTSSNGGGADATGFGPANWNDGVDEAGCGGAGCMQCYGWISNDANSVGAFMELNFPAEVTIGSMYVDTSVAAPPCGGANRTVYAGDVQYWNGAAFVTVQSFDGAAGDTTFDFDPPIDTTRLRLANVQTPPGGMNSLMFEWSVYEPLGCTP